MGIECLQNMKTENQTFFHSRCFNYHFTACGLSKSQKNIVRDLHERERLFVILNSLVTTFTVITINDVTLVLFV